MFAVSPTTHTINWFYQTDDELGSGFNQSSDSSPGIGVDSTIYFSSFTADFFGVNTDGSLRWIFPLPMGSLDNNLPTSAPAVDSYGLIYIGDVSGYLYALSPYATLEWLYDTGDGDAISSSPTLSPDENTIYFGSTDDKLYAVQDGVKKWSYATGGAIISSAVAAPDLIAFGSTDDSIYILNTNGTLKSKVTTGGQVTASPALAQDGAIIVGSQDGKVYCLTGSSSIPTTAGWTMFHQNAQHTGAAPNPASGVTGPSAVPNNIAISAGNFTFNLTGTPNVSADVFVSPDLINWTYQSTATLDARGNVSYADDSAGAGVTNRFYQAIVGGICSDVVGYIYVTFPANSRTLMANQFYGIDDQSSVPEWPQNTLLNWEEFLENNGLLSSLPNNFQVQQWNGTAFVTNTWSTFGQTWSSNGDAMILPGEASYFVNPSGSAITLPFAGKVPKGAFSNPVYHGTNYISSLVPMAGHLQTDLQYNPTVGDVVIVGSTSHTFSGGTNWSNGEPSLQPGQGFYLNAAAANTWAQDKVTCADSGYINVPANPLWTDTGVVVQSNSVIHFPVQGTWSGNVGEDGFCGPQGLTNEGIADNFLSSARHYSLIAFVSTNASYTPYENAQGVYSVGTSYFPLPNGHGYFLVGTNGSFTSDRPGTLWLGINDDAVDGTPTDNAGSLTGTLSVTH